MSSKFQKIKEECYLANLELPKLGLVLFTFGNVSVVDRVHQVFAIKPSGVPYENLAVEDMVVVDFDGQVVEGKLKPSSDTHSHAVLYKHWAHIGSIVHTHSTYATAWAQSLRDIPVYGTTHADYTISAIPCAAPMKDEKIKGDYEIETGHQIIDCFKERNLDYQELEMILVGSHAPFTWGKDAKKAVHNSAVLEFIAKTALFTEQINKDASPMKDSLNEKHFQRKHGPNSYYGQ
jgi:L-ribulose-5-phosphate 4-epimerase